MTPYGAMPTGGNFCNTCGCAQGATSGYGFQNWPGQNWPAQTWPGTFAQMTGFPSAGPTFGPSFGGPGPSWSGFGGAGFNQPSFGGFGGGGNVPWSGAGFGGPWFAPSPLGFGWGLGGLRRWGGTYSPQYLTTGLPTDEEISEMIYDAIDADPLIPYDADINVDTDAGTVTLSGTVPSKQIKHAAGDDAWWIPGVDDVRNDLQVVSRRPARGEQPPAATTSRAPQPMRERSATTARR